MQSPLPRLRAINLVLFPDWSLSLPDLAIELGMVLRKVLRSQNQKYIALIIEFSGTSSDTANLLLTNILMNFFLEEDVELEEEPNLILLEGLSERDWATLSAHIQLRIELENERKEIPNVILQHTRSSGLNEFVNPNFDLSLSPAVHSYKDLIMEIGANQSFQCRFEEYAYIVDRVVAQGCGNFLVFGVGNDSRLWLAINKNAKTVFVEDNPEWLARTQEQFPQAEMLLVSYNTQRQQWLDLLLQYIQGNNNLEMELPEVVRSTPWDFIFVDAPAGFGDHLPGRMKSIYMAFKLAYQNQKLTEVFVHDSNRVVENIYSNYFFHPCNLVTHFYSLRHYQLDFRHPLERG